jgi:hypothetical protein
VLHIERLKGAVERDVLTLEDAVEFGEAFLYPDFQLRRQLLILEALRGFCFFDVEAVFVLLVVMGSKLAEADVVFLHLKGELLGGDASISILIQFLKEEAYFLTGEVGVDVPDEALELLVVQLLRPLEPQVLQQPSQVNVLAVHLKTQLPHHCLQLVLEVLVLLRELLESALEDRMQEDLIP